MFFCEYEKFLQKYVCPDKGKLSGGVRGEEDYVFGAAPTQV